MCFFIDYSALLGNLNAGKVEFQNLVISEALLRHCVSAPLTHADAVSPAGAVERIAGRIGNGRRGIRAGIARITAVCVLVIAGIVARGFDKHSAACVVKINVKANRLADIAQLVVVVAVDDVAVQCDLLAVEHNRRGGFADFLHRRGRIRKLAANGLIRRAGGQENAFILLIPTDIELTFGAAQQIGSTCF